MRILFDHGTPVPLRRELPDHEVSTAYEMGWSNLSNGELLREAEAAFDALITTDQNLPFQQNLDGLRLAILILPTTSWPRIRRFASEVRDAVARIKPGEVTTIEFDE